MSNKLAKTNEDILRKLAAEFNFSLDHELTAVKKIFAEAVKTIKTSISKFIRILDLFSQLGPAAISDGVSRVSTFLKYAGTKAVNTATALSGRLLRQFRSSRMCQIMAGIMLFGFVRRSCRSGLLLPERQTWQNAVIAGVGYVRTILKSIMPQTIFVPLDAGLGYLQDSMVSSFDSFSAPLFGLLLIVCPVNAPTDREYLAAASAVYDHNNLRQVSKRFMKKIDTHNCDVWVDEKAKVVLVGCKGTSEGRDWAANYNIMMNKLSFSRIYQVCFGAVQRAEKKFQPSRYTYYATGHSLGGALAAQLVRDFSFFKKAIVFNAAMQQGDFDDPQHSKIERFFVEGDIINILNNVLSSSNNFKEFGGNRTVSFRDRSVQSYLMWKTGIAQHSLTSFQPKFRQMVM